MSTFITEIQDYQFPRLFDAFEDAVGSDAWLKRAKAIDTEIKSKPLLKDFLLTENRIAYTLKALTHEKHKRGKLSNVRVESLGAYETCTLVSQFMSLHSTLPQATARRLARRLHGGFKNPDDLRGLQFEWLIATQLIKRQFDVDFPAETEGTHDFVAKRNGISMDIECKSISHDKGRQIHRRDALELYSILFSQCQPFIRSLSKGLLVRVTVPGKLPPAHSDRRKLGERVHRGIVSGAGVSELDLEVRLYDFDVASSPLLPYPPDMASVRSFFEKSFGIRNRELVVLYSDEGRALVICLESKMPDRLVEATLDTIKDASDRQLSGRYAGVVCVKFEGLTADELVKVGDETGSPTDLRVAVSRFMDSRKNSHLVCLGFFADGPLERKMDGSITRGGRTYFFENKDSPHHNDIAADAFRDFS